MLRLYVFRSTPPVPFRKNLSGMGPFRWGPQCCFEVKLGRALVKTAASMILSRPVSSFGVGEGTWFRSPAEALVEVRYERYLAVSIVFRLTY